MPLRLELCLVKMQVHVGPSPRANAWLTSQTFCHAYVVVPVDQRVIRRKIPDLYQQFQSVSMSILESVDIYLIIIQTAPHDVLFS